MFPKDSTTKPGMPGVGLQMPGGQPGDMESRVSDLESRIQALEDQQKVPDIGTPNQPGQ